MGGFWVWVGLRVGNLGAELFGVFGLRVSGLGALDLRFIGVVLVLGFGSFGVQGFSVWGLECRAGQGRR